MASEDLEPGTVVGRYRVKSRLGVGGMGEVYRAVDIKLEREVALKLLSRLPDDARADIGVWEKTLAAETFSHPNVAEVYEYGEGERGPFLAMELLDGRSLREILSKESRLDPQRVLEFAIGVAEGLAAAHEKGIVHRDLKPESIIVTADEKVKLLDFGMSRLLSQHSKEGEGLVLGSVYYMSPEQARGQAPGPASDIFSFGVCLYEALSGRSPFRRESAAGSLHAVLADDPQPLTSLVPGVPEGLGRLVHRCLAKDPKRRIGSGRELLNDLEELAAGPLLRGGAPSAALHSFAPIALLALVVGGSSGGVVGYLVGIAELFSGSDAKFKFVQIPVFYATDRAPSGRPDPDDFYGADPGALTYGMCRVSIPGTHVTGELERPWTIFRVELPERAESHIVLGDVEEYPNQDAMVTALSTEIGLTERKELLLFIHGYNTSFAEAARRTGQLAYDLGFYRDGKVGTAAFYSWPSRGEAFHYVADDTSIEAAESNLREMLNLLVARSGARNIHVVAHSKGAELFTSALRDLEAGERTPPYFNQVVLAAPDIDARRFRRDIAPRVTASASGTTVYASANDSVLTLSETVNKAPRLGQAGSRLVVMPGVQTVDCTSVSTGHSYFADVPSVLKDIGLVVKSGLPPVDRGLEERRQAGVPYWAFRPERAP